MNKILFFYWGSHLNYFKRVKNYFDSKNWQILLQKFVELFFVYLVYLKYLKNKKCDISENVLKSFYFVYANNLYGIHCIVTAYWWNINYNSSKLKYCIINITKIFDICVYSVFYLYKILFFLFTAVKNSVIEQLNAYIVFSEGNFKNC